MLNPITTLGGVSIVHLAYKSNDSEPIDWRIACMPHVTNFATAAHHHNYLRSDATPAVTCAACKATAIFKKVKETEHY